MAADRAAQAVGHDGDLALRTVAQDDAELVAGDAADDVGGAQAARHALAGGDDHLVAGIEAVAVVDHREAVDRGDEEGAVALFGAGAVDGLRQLGAERVAVEMTGELVAGRQIGEALHLALLLGGDAQHAGEFFGAAVGPRIAHADHGEPDRAERRGGFERDLERGELRIARLDEGGEAAAAVGAEPGVERGAARQAREIGVIGQDVDGAIPLDAVVGDGPVERGDSGGEERKTQALGLSRCRERIKTVGRLLLKRLTHHIHHPWPIFRPIARHHARRGFKKAVIPRKRVGNEAGGPGFALRTGYEPVACSRFDPLRAAAARGAGCARCRQSQYFPNARW